ncbi:MAG: D-aminoacyl-tRNA deacylase [Candidatus Woesearchaeota archaeon]
MKFQKVAIITAKPDPASQNIKTKLLALGFAETSESFEGEKVYSLGDCRVYTPSKQPIDCEHLDKQIEADLFVFATKHRSEAGKHSLSVHVPGNWGKAELGGQDGHLCIVPASVIRIALLELQTAAKGLQYEVTLEATHHGPLVDKPCFFIEIGSDESQWSNEEAGRIIAETIMKTLDRREETFPTVMVLGGGHYNQLANRILSGTNYAVGHICAKYALKELDSQLIVQAIKRSVEPVEMIILDWKGLGDQKEKIKELEKTCSLKFKRFKEVMHEE